MGMVFLLPSFYFFYKSDLICCGERWSFSWRLSHDCSADYPYVHISPNSFFSHSSYVSSCALRHNLKSRGMPFFTEPILVPFFTLCSWICLKYVFFIKNPIPQIEGTLGKLKIHPPILRTFYGFDNVFIHFVFGNIFRFVSWRQWASWEKLLRVGGASLADALSISPISEVSRSLCELRPHAQPVGWHREFGVVHSFCFSRLTWGESWRLGRCNLLSPDPSELFLPVAVTRRAQTFPSVLERWKTLNFRSLGLQRWENQW